MFGKKKTEELSTDHLSDLFGGVVEPETAKTISDLNWIHDVAIEADQIRLHLKLPTPAWAGRPALKDALEKALEKNVKSPPKLNIAWDFEVLPARPQSNPGQNLIPNAKNIILFASGKGGVGKSTIATNVAAALAQTGASVGLLDADIYGPSIPTMLGGDDERPEVSGQKLIPPHRHGLKLMSVGYVVDPTDAMVWRGPMLNSALLQFMRDVEWGELDYMVLDLPPGTGDVQLTIAQNLKVSGAVLVSTPQEVALADVIRGKAMFDKVEIPTLGVVENMSYFVCDGCDKKHEIFSTGGASSLAAELGVPVLGEIPIEQTTRAAADSGTPAVLAHPDSKSAQAFKKIAETLATELAIEAMAAASRPSKSLKIVQ